MSNKQQTVLIVPPLFPGEFPEEREVFGGISCSYCHGKGWFWGTDMQREHVKMDCPLCKGSGKLKAEVTVRWMPDKKE